VRTIWKYPIGYEGEHTISIPRCLGDENEIMKFKNQVLFVGNQNEIPTIWAVVDDTAVKRDVPVLVYGTGFNCNDAALNKYLGSVTTHNGNFVWHLFVK